jgi:hypothetical protein
VLAVASIIAGQLPGGATVTAVVSIEAGAAEESPPPGGSDAVALPPVWAFDEPLFLFGSGS